MLDLAIIATIFCFLSFIDSIINTLKNKESKGNSIFSVIMHFINKSVIITVIWILYSNIK